MSDDRDESTEATEPMVFSPSKVWLAGQRKRFYVMALASVVVAPVICWAALPADVFWLGLTSVVIVLGASLLLLRIIAIRRLQAQRAIVDQDRLEVRARWLGEKMAFRDVAVVVCGEDPEGQIRSLELWNSPERWHFKAKKQIMRIHLTGYEDMPRLRDAIEVHLPATVDRRTRRARGEAADFRWFVWWVVRIVLFFLLVVIVVTWRG